MKRKQKKKLPGLVNRAQTSQPHTNHIPFSEERTKKKNRERKSESFENREPSEDKAQDFHLTYFLKKRKKQTKRKRKKSPLAKEAKSYLLI